MDDILKNCMLSGLRYYRDESKQMLAMAHDRDDAERLERRIHRLDDRIRDWDLENRQMH